MAAKKKTKKKRKKYYTSDVLRKMERLDRMIEDIRKSEDASKKADMRLSAAGDEIRKTGERILEKETGIEETGKDILKREEDIAKKQADIAESERMIDDELKKVAMLTFLVIKKERALELARGVAGAVLGVALGFSLMSTPALASGVAWENAIIILAFILGISAFLIYKNEKEWVERRGTGFVIRTLATLFVICICIEAVSLLLFGVVPADAGILAKTLIIGSYPAMAGAVAFTLA